MSVSFVGQPIGVKLRAMKGDSFIQTDNGGGDYIFDLYAIDDHRALILNEHELVWVELERVYVLLADDLPDPEPEREPALPDPSEPEA